MIKKIFIYLSILILTNISSLKSNEVKIITKVGKQIITNIDIENEYKYLVSLNNSYQNLNKGKILNFARESLVREKIKEFELKNYFNIGEQDPFLDNKIKEFYLSLGFQNAEDFENYLKEYDLKVEDVSRKIEIELKWNKLIYDKYKDRIKINNDILKSKIINESKNLSVLNLSELIFSYENEKEIDLKIKEVLESIEKVGFENSVLIFSNADSRSQSGNLGWINELSLSKNIVSALEKVKISEITKPIKIQNGILILKLNDKKKSDQTFFDIDKELEKLITFEKNKQLNVFSSVHFEKIKNKLNANK